MGRQDLGGKSVTHDTADARNGTHELGHRNSWKKRKSPAAGEALERNLLEDRGACSFFFGLGLFALFLGQASVFHHAHHEIAVVVLDHGGEGVEGLDGEPLLVDVPAVLDVGLVNGGGLYRLAVLESELLGHVGGGLDGLVLAGFFYTAGTDFEGVELVVLVEDEVHLHRQFAELEHGDDHTFAFAALAIGLVTHLHDLFDDGLAVGAKGNACKIFTTLGESAHGK